MYSFNIKVNKRHMCESIITVEMGVVIHNVIVYSTITRKHVKRYKFSIV